MIMKPNIFTSEYVYELWKTDVKYSPLVDKNNEDRCYKLLEYVLLKIANDEIRKHLQSEFDDGYSTGKLDASWDTEVDYEKKLRRLKEVVLQSINSAEDIFNTELETYKHVR